jgi:hypothetical protein
MLTTTGQVLAVLGVLGTAIVYGTDVYAGLVTRSAYRRLDDATMTLTAGWGHYYADRRMPFAGVGGLIATVATLVAAVAAGKSGAAIAMGVALIPLMIWLGCYITVAKPVNRAQTSAAVSGVIPPNARALQEKWDSVVLLRVILQGAAVAAQCTALALL